MQTLSFLMSKLIEIYTMILLLRLWMQWARCDFYNPFSQFVVKATQRVVSPLRRVIPSFGAIDTASLLIALLLSLLKAAMLLGIASGSALVQAMPYVLLFGLFILLKTIGLLIFWVLIIMSIMSWVSQGRNPMEYVLIQLASPLLNPVRRILPGMGGIDFSPMVVLLLLYAINMAVGEILMNYSSHLPGSGATLLMYLWRVA